MPRTRTLTLDLHVHTNYSHDGRASVEEVIESAIVKKLDGIAICDHNTMEGSYAAQKYVADNDVDLIIIPGIEVSTSKGHLLLLGIKDSDEGGLKKDLSAEETIRRARQHEKDENAPVVIIAPHPFHPFRHSSGNFCTHTGIDAIEVFNSRYFTGIANEMARRTAARTKSTTVAGSDAHSADCVGLATVEVAVDVDFNANAAQKPECEVILRALKEGKVQIKDTKRTPFWLYFSQMCLKKR
jgi:predicted metal-dependent phosphoesterase TrpH